MEYANENTIDSQKRMKILLFEILQVHKLSDNLHPQMIFRIFLKPGYGETQPGTHVLQYTLDPSSFIHKEVEQFTA
jgi:hypothetical protein